MSKFYIRANGIEKLDYISAGRTHPNTNDFSLFYTKVGDEKVRHIESDIQWE